VGEGKVHLEDTLCFKTHWPVMNTPEPEVSRFVMVLRHPVDAALSYASYSLSSNNVRYWQPYVVEQPCQHTPRALQAHDNVVSEEAMREHMQKDSPLKQVTNQFHYYVWLWKMCAPTWHWVAIPP
jgi:hypothetical protein